ncbi:MAG: nicotinate phosphoribosyltransferase [Lachnospirales bacterium]
MRNLTMLTDFYQLTMMQGYFVKNKHNTVTVFDMFYRKNPDRSSFSILAGNEQLVEYIENLHFNDEDIEYLRTFNIFQEDFLSYLKNFKFTGDIYSFLEGSVILPYEPIIRVKAPIFECQLIETALLNIINHQSLIASKATRVANAAGEAAVLEFGLRRAQGTDAGVYGARAAYIGGCVGTSNVLAGQLFDIPVSGTHAHSWIMSFDTELEAFVAYGEIYQETCILLVDTYNTLKSGVPNAIKTFDILKERGILPKKIGIRLDSGDMAYLSKNARKMLDDGGYKNAIISASNDLDETLISALKSQGAKIDLYGVGTNLITSKDTPAFGGVYKVSAVEKENGEFEPKIKLSNNPQKITTPGIKQVVRLYDKKSGKFKADLVTLDEEFITEEKDLKIFAPNATWKSMTLKANEFTCKKMLEPMFIKGEFVGEKKSAKEIREYCNKEKETIWEESKRLNFPQELYVDLSKSLYNLKQDMINSIRGENV